jgi:hypothetical protein
MPRLRAAAPHELRAIRLSGGRSRRLLTHDEGAVPTVNEYAAWRKPKSSCAALLQRVVYKQRTVLTNQAAELKLPVAAAAKQLAAALELAKQVASARAKEREGQAAEKRQQSEHERGS